jgi:hypothetical protein
MVISLPVLATDGLEPAPVAQVHSVHSTVWTNHQQQLIGARLTPPWLLLTTARLTATHYLIK